MKFVLQDIGKAVRWTASLGKKLFKVVPGYTILAVISSILSQFFLLAGFLLPLKVVLLLGSDHVPGYFPSSLQALGRDGLVLILSVASVCFYLFHLLTGKFVEISATAGSSRLLLKSRKMAIFENQQDIASKGYHRFSQSMAAISFVAICLVAMSVFYPALVVVIAGYVSLSLLLVASLSSFSDVVHGRVYGSLGPTAKLIGSIGFLVSFGFIVIDHLYGSPPGLILSVISLLLTRQLFGRLSNLVKDMQGLYSQKQQLSALFFHGHAFQPQTKNRQKGIWGLIKPEIRDQWLKELLESTVGQPITDLSARWVDIGVPDVLCYQVSLTCDQQDKVLVVKLFNTNRSAWAKHEATLLTSQPSLPSLPFLSATSVQGLHCHVLDATSFSRCDKIETTREEERFKNLLAGYSPSEELTAVYLRSRPQAWQRFDQDLLVRMEHLLGPKAKEGVVEEFRKRLPGIQQILAKLPLAIDLPDLRSGMLWKNEEGDYVVSHWARWDLVPLGADWPIDTGSDERLRELLEETASKRDEVKEVSSEAVRLSALFTQFETRLRRGRYFAAYDLISSMLSAFEAVEV